MKVFVRSSGARTKLPQPSKCRREMNGALLSRGSCFCSNSPFSNWVVGSHTRRGSAGSSSGLNSGWHSVRGLLGEGAVLGWLLFPPPVRRNVAACWSLNNLIFFPSPSLFPWCVSSTLSGSLRTWPQRKNKTLQLRTAKDQNSRGGGATLKEVEGRCAGPAKSLPSQNSSIL